MMKTKLLLTAGILGTALSLIIAGCGTTTAHVPNTHPSHTSTATKTPQATPSPIVVTAPTIVGNSPFNTEIDNYFMHNNPAYFIFSGAKITIAKVVTTYNENIITVSGQFYANQASACQAKQQSSVTSSVYATLTLYEPLDNTLLPPLQVVPGNPTGASLYFNC